MMNDITENSVKTKAPSVKDKKSRRSGPWKQIVVGGIIFFCGALVGVILTLGVVRIAVYHSIRHPEEAPQRITRRLKRRLDLSESQANEIQPIIREHINVLLEIRRETRPRVQKVLDELRDDVAEKLNEKQARRWRSDIIRFRELFPGNGPEPPEGDDSP